MGRPLSGSLTEGQAESRELSKLVLGPTPEKVVGAGPALDALDYSASASASARLSAGHPEPACSPVARPHQPRQPYHPTHLRCPRKPSRGMTLRSKGLALAKNMQIVTTGWEVAAVSNRIALYLLRTAPTGGSQKPSFCNNLRVFLPKRPSSNAPAHPGATPTAMGPARYAPAPRQASRRSTARRHVTLRCLARQHAGLGCSSPRCAGPLGAYSSPMMRAARWATSALAFSTSMPGHTSVPSALRS